MTEVFDVNEGESNQAGDISLSFMTRISRILECLSQGYNSVSDIAEYCSFTSSTTHRLLNTLKTTDLIVGDPISHRYYLGPMLLKLITNPKTTHQFIALCSLKEMQYLADLSNENVSLDIMIGFQSTNLHFMRCKHGLQVSEDDIIVTPVLPSGSTWKVLLSQLESRELKKALSIARELQSASQHESNVWFEQIKQIQHDGIAVSYGEKLVGTIGISSPVKNYQYPVVLTIVGPEGRLFNRVPELMAAVRDSASRLSRQVKVLFQ